MPIGGSRLLIFSTDALPASTTTKSLDFTRASSQHLYMAIAGHGTINRDKFAISVWYDLDQLPSTAGGNMMMWTENNNLGLIALCGVGANDTIYFGAGYNLGTDTTHAIQTTTADKVLVSGYHHLYAVYDSSEAVSTDRMRLYQDGVRITSFSAPVYPGLNDDCTDQLSTFVTVGAYKDYATSIATDFMDGRLYDTCIFSGAIPNITDVYNAGVPPLIDAIAAAYSHLNVNGGAVEDDRELATNWTNVNTVISSVTIP